MDLARQLEAVMPTELVGSVARTVGMTVSVADFPAPVGALAEIRRHSGPPLLAEVIGFRDELTVLYPFSELVGVRHGNRVRLVRTSRWLRVGPELLGRVIDAQGKAVDGRPEPALSDRASFRLGARVSRRSLRGRPHAAALRLSHRLWTRPLE